MPSLRCPVSLCVLMLGLAVTAAPAGQASDPKADFVQALGQFSLTLNGTFGDEGSRLRPQLDAMERALAQWDGVIRGYESAMTADLKSAPPPLAFQMHVALGGVYLDRGRVSDAMQEFALAARLDPSRVDVPAFEALAHSQIPRDSAAAVAALRKASMLDPANPVRAYLLARQLARGGASTEADQVLQRFDDLQTSTPIEPGAAPVMPFIRLGLVPETAGIEPFFPPALYADAFARLQAGDFTRALAMLRDAIARDPLAGPTIEAGALARAATAFRDGSLQAALDHVTTAIELAPESAESRRIMGLVYAAAGRHDEAIDALKRAVQLNPRDERARVGLADALAGSGRLEDAVVSLRETVKLLPSSGRARYALGLAHQRQGLYPDAMREFTEAAAMTPLLGLNSLYQTMGALARAQQYFDDAIAAFSQRVDLIPNDAGAHRELGDMYLRQSRLAEAQAEFAVAVMLDPSRADSFTALGQVYLRQGRFPAAVSAARSAVTLDASHKEARYLLATSLMRLGNTEEGKRELEVYQRLQTEATAARARQLEVDGFRRDAALSTANQDYEKAVTLLRQALERDPESAASHLDLGIALLKAGHPADAVDALKAAVSRNAPAEAHAYLAQAYDTLGQRENSERERDLYELMRQEALRRSGAGR